MTELIYHIALAADWATAMGVGDYRISTIGRTLEQEGFLHFCRTAGQLAGVAQRYYGDVTDPLCLLTVDTGLLTVPIVDESPAPGVAEKFPHLYAPLPVSAVLRVTPLTRDASGALGPLPSS